MISLEAISLRLKTALSRCRRRLQRHSWLPGAMLGFCVSAKLYWPALVLFCVLCWLTYPYFVWLKKLGTDKEVAAQFVWVAGGTLWGSSIMLRAIISQPSEDIALIMSVLTYASYLFICFGFLSIGTRSLLSVLLLRKNLLLLRDRYGIDVQYPIDRFPISSESVKLDGERLSQWQLAVAVSTVAAEIRKLPDALVERCEIRRIVLCSRFSEDGLRMGGMCFARQYALCLDVFRAVPNQGRLSRSFYHELFHMIYARDDNWRKKSAVWLGLNPRDFDYGPSARNMIREGIDFQPHDTHLGFLTQYSKADAEEDAAELFSYLMTSYGKVKRKAQRDRFFAAKVLYMQERLAYFCPDLDERFWYKIAKNG